MSILSRFPRATRIAFLLLVVALASWSVAEHLAWQGRRTELMDLLARTGTATRSPGAAEDVGREPDRRRAALRTARALVADELDRAWQSELTLEERDRARREGLDKLESAGEIAATTLARRPGSWQAAEVLGASRYLLALRRGRPMTAERREAWQRPLEAARVRGPGQPEPVRFLAAAYLSEWARLSQLERDEAVNVLEEGFTDPTTFDLLATSWLRLAPSREVAFSVIPPEPRAWAGVMSHYARRLDWSSFALAHDRQRDALHHHLDEILERARIRLALGDNRRARWYALEVIGTAPPSLRFAPLLSRAIEVLPAGPLGEVRRQRLSEWLAWSRDRCLLGDCPFADGVLARMAGLSPAGEPAESAAFAEMGGDELTADRLAGDANVFASAWSPFHLLRARRQAREGDLEGARRSLEQVHPQWRSRAAYFELLAASSNGPSSDGRPRGRSWPASAWTGDRLPVLELASDTTCAGLEIEILTLTSEGAAVEILWDGDLAGTHPVAPGRSLRLDLEVFPARTHTLVIDSFVYPQLRPGRVRLRDCAA